MMASTELSTSVLKAKFRGCMIGALVGDCLGFPFEFKDFECELNTVKKVPPSKEKINVFMTDVLNEESTMFLKYTDDTAMTMNIASSLVEKGEINAKDISKRFVADFYNQKVSRGYGANVCLVFSKLKESDFADIFSPARQQFNGKGSFGNGASMRISPIALFGHSRGEEFIMNAAKECSLITHAHPNGYNGGILQSLAVSAALGLKSSKKFESSSFIDNLLKEMENIETEEEKPYCDKLKKMKFLLEKEDASSKEIAEYLGNGSDISALESVPTAIYSFIRGMKPLKFNDNSKKKPKSIPSAIYSFFKGASPETDFESSNPFMRTIYFAISVGGDTDTIGSMAGAIAGAYYGESMIPDVVKNKCEAFDDVLSLADKLFHVTYKDK